MTLLIDTLVGRDNLIVNHLIIEKVSNGYHSKCIIDPYKVVWIELHMSKWLEELQISPEIDQKIWKVSLKAAKYAL